MLKIFVVGLADRDSKSQVILSLRERDPNAGISYEGNPRMFWCRTSLEERDILGIPNVEDTFVSTVPYYEWKSTDFELPYRAEEN